MERSFSENNRASAVNIALARGINRTTGSRLFQKILLEVIHPGIAVIQLRIRSVIERAFEAAAAGFKVRLLGRNLGMGRQIVHPLDNLLSFFRQNEIEQKHRGVGMR